MLVEFYNVFLGYCKNNHKLNQNKEEKIQLNIFLSIILYTMVIEMVKRNK